MVGSKSNVVAALALAAFTGCGGSTPEEISSTESQIVDSGAIDRDHRFVGALLELHADGTVRVRCSGSLIASTIFLTAAHCVVGVPATIELGVTFVDVLTPIGSENQIVPPATVVTGTAYVHPGYSAPAQPVNDVAVLVLDSAVTFVGTAQLPPEGWLDELAAQGGLLDRTFIDVGYGAIAASQGGHVIEFSPARRSATAEFRALTPTQLILSENPALGLGGTCYGDSGGPSLLFGTNTIAGITSTGDAVCRAMERMQRVDTPEVRAFLGQFVTLP
jgi:secreted trypsin-like serine protease